MILFSFPNKYTKEWAKVVNRPNWTPKSNSAICSRHFSVDCITGKKLKDGSEPISTDKEHDASVVAMGEC